MSNNINDAGKIQNILDSVAPSATTYNDWLRLGMACKTAGLPCDVWDNWSRNDNRYKAGDCSKRWRTFNDSVGIGTAIYIARQYGFVIPSDWRVDPATIVPYKGSNRSANWVKKMTAPVDMMTEEEFNAVIANGGKDRAEQALRFIGALFNDDDVIGLCRSFETDPEYPEPIVMRFETAATVKNWIICGHDDAEPIDEPDDGTFNPFYDQYVTEHTTLPRHILVNPVKPAEIGKKCDATAANIADYRHILLESDESTAYNQYKTFCTLNLPIAALVFSGNKSVHALVKVYAATTDEYRDRFETIQRVCADAGISIDVACKNVNRWTRLAGARRGSNNQTLISTNVGAGSWEAWEEYLNDERARATLDVAKEAFGIRNTSLTDLMRNPPDPVPHIIKNALKRGREGILIASSKAGKSWLMLKLAKACADGGEWLGYDCAQSRVGVVNMELGDDDIFERMSLLGTVNNPENIQFLNCAGVCSDLERLQDAIESFAKYYSLDLLIIDPVYSLMGELDENKNGDVMRFLERLAQIRRNTGCASFMTHHTSKGSQDGKASIDMGSGAGAFARHPDCIITMMTATPENLKGLSDEELEYDRLNGVHYFVLNETLRSFKSRRNEEVWRADFPEYERVDRAKYDRMGAAHTARSDASSFKYRNAVQECLKHGEPPTQANVAARAGVSKSSMSEWAKAHRDEWDAITENTHL